MSPELRQALKRPDNYDKLSSAEQWEIDKRLGILDWEPTATDQAEYQKIMRRKKDAKYIRLLECVVCGKPNDKCQCRQGVTDKKCKEIHGKIVAFVEAQSGGVKFLELLTYITEYTYLHKQCDLVNLVEYLCRTSSKVAVLDYSMPELERQKMFIYIPLPHKTKGGHRD